MSDEWNGRLLSRKMATFCRRRLSPLAQPADVKNLRSYLAKLIANRAYPPTKRRDFDWEKIAERSRVEALHATQLRDEIRPALEALVRALNASGAPATQPPQASRADKTPAIDTCKRARKTPRTAAIGGTDLTSSVGQGRPRRRPKAATAKRRRTRKPRPIVEFPRSTTDQWDDPAAFPEALALHIQRHGETYWLLHRAVTRPGEKLGPKTIRTWLGGTRSPRSVASLEVLKRIERRYQLPEGYFQTKLPHHARAANGHELQGVSPAERRRLAWHLPDDFNSLPVFERERILEWVRRVIISGSTDYRRFQAAAIKQRYAIKFPGLAGGGPSLEVSGGELDEEEGTVSDDDPELQPGRTDAPPRLRSEMAELLRFKTSTLTAFGFQRSGVWGEETAAQKVEHLGLMLGALAASPNSSVRGLGVRPQDLTLGLLVFPPVWDWYVQWRERRRGFYTAWEVDMLRVALALNRRETGWLRQHPELIAGVRPIAGLVSPQDISIAQNDWDGACDQLFKHATSRVKEVQRAARVHRDPFEPILPILEAASPVAEYRKITDEILNRMPDPRRHPRAAAEAVRSFLMLRLGMHLGLRQKNLRQLLVCPRDHRPRSERQLIDLKRGEIRWSDRDGGWEVWIPAAAFKNSNSSYFGSKPFRLVLPNLAGLYDHIETYLNRYRRLLLAGAADPGTFFVKTVKKTSSDAAYDQTSFYEAWRLTIQRYGIYNPFTRRGAIQGLLPHGPHNVRDVLATHILKQTGSYEQASYAIQDTPDMVAKHYGRFLPQDKAALAAQILNKVWDAA